MKKAILVLMLLVLVFSMCSCGTSGQSSYLLINGEKHDLDYFSSLNDLQRQELSGETPITVVSALVEVCGPGKITPLDYAESSITLSGGFQIETTGHEDTVMNWKPGDMIEASGVFTFMFGSSVLMNINLAHQKQIIVKNLTRNESFDIKC